MRLIPFFQRTKERPSLSEDQRRFARGTRTVAEILAPAAGDVERDHLRLEYQYARVLAFIGYPRSVEAGWLKTLVTSDDPIEISMHVHPLETAQVMKMLHHKLVQLESSRRLIEKREQLDDPERLTAVADIENLRNALQRGDEKAFSVSLYLLLRAASTAELDLLTRRVELVLNGVTALSRVTIGQQDRGFRSCLPEGTDQLLIYRNFDTTSVAYSFLFSSSSLSLPDGVLYGFDDQNHPLIFDPFHPSLENANSVVFAKSGAGKSYFTKLTALRLLYTGIDFLVVDPEDEYRRLCQQVEGQYIRLASSSGQHLNPFDLPPADAGQEEGRDPLGEQVAALIALVEVMIAEPGKPLSVGERAVLDTALYETYASAGIISDPTTHSAQPPLLSDFHAVLAKTPGEVAANLAARLRRYVSGSLAGLFGGPTNVELGNRFVVFNIQALEPELRPVAIHLIAGFVWNRVRRSRRPRLLIIDEAWALMQYPEGAAFLASMARRARKYFLGLQVITQDVADFLGSDHGRTVLANAAIKVLMQQDESTIEPVANAFRLSDRERQVLLTAAKGSGLFFVKGGHLGIHVEASPREHSFITTAPRELAAQEAA